MTRKVLRVGSGKNLLIFSWFVTKKIMMINSNLKFSEYMQNISKSKSFGKFVFIVFIIATWPKKSH